MLCDLHVHTSASDGLYGAAEVVARARELGLRAVAITDHDTTAGIEQALAAAKDLGLTVVPGIEISTEWRENEIHILGYFLDYHRPSFQEGLARRREGRLRRARKIVNRLHEIGLDVSWNRVLGLAGEGAIGRPHIAMAMVEKGYVATVAEAFDSYLNRGAPAYVPRSAFTPVEAVEMIRGARGVPVLAHPGLLRARELVEDLLEIGVGGLEAYHPGHDDSTVEWLVRVAEERSLIITGGSDFHGYAGEEYGFLGTCGVDWDKVIALREAADATRGT